MDSRLALAATEMAEGLSRAIIVEESRTHLSKEVHQAVEELGKHGVHATPQILSGSPAHALVQEAERWGADCIFLGAKRHGGIEGALLGSVSNAVAAQSHCSVEIVRPLCS
jgi:nucleotide-binding universal stress UspA family protein